jgi:hypothetical protein
MSEFKRSEQINELASALAKAQINYETAVRSKKNTYTGSKYAELQDLMEATQKPLATEGLTVVHFPIEDLQNKRAGAVTLLVHSSGQFLQNELLLPATGKAQGGAEKLDAQTIGAAVTYAKRINYQGLAGIVGESEDDGNEIADKSADNAESVPKPKTVAAPPVSKAPANKGQEPRPNEPKPAPKTAPEPQPVAQNRPETHDPKPEAPAVPAGMDSVENRFPEQFEPKPLESKTSTPPQEVKPSAQGEKPTKSQLDGYIARVRDEIKPALEKAGLRPSAKLQTGAKLKQYILFKFGAEAKDLTDLSVSEWDAFLNHYEVTNDNAAIVAEIEKGSK